MCWITKSLFHAETPYIALQESKKGKRQNHAWELGRIASIYIQTCQKMFDEGPEISSQVYLHNGFSNVQKWFLYKFPDTMDFSSSYDKILWLVILQHQPHSLERDRQIPVKVTASYHLGNIMLSNTHNCVWTLLKGKLKHINIYFKIFFDHTWIWI